MTYALPRRATCGASRFSKPTLSQYFGLWRQRQALKSLDNAALRDVGLTREQANAEAQRGFWDAPSNWYC
ncbi:DUF1127 domain-containing protein [Arenibacterium sp. CAU 1754]